MFLGKKFYIYRKLLGVLAVIAINVLLFVIFALTDKIFNTSTLQSLIVVIVVIVLLNFIFWLIDIFYKYENNLNSRIFKEFTENINEVFWRATPDLSQTIYVSPAYDEIWGKSRENLYKNPYEWFESIVHEDQARVKNILLSLGQEDIPNVTFEFEIKRPNGELRQIYTRGFKFKNKKGQLINILGISTDITHYKKEEEAKDILKDINVIFDLKNHLSAVVPKVLRTICMARNWDFGEMWLVDKEVNALRSISIWDNSEWDMKSEFNIQTQTTTYKSGVKIPGEIWKLGQLLWIEDLDDIVFKRMKEAAHEGFHSAIGLPIIINKSIIGVMDFFSHEIKKPDEITIRMLKKISEQLGEYIEKKHNEDQMILASRRDAQTSLLNRSALIDNLGKLLISTTTSIALLLFELDRFKLISSLIGYDATDLLLKMVVNRFSKISPEFEEQLGRYETNLFAFYLPYHEIDEVIQYSNAILNLFDEPFFINQQYFYLSANIGISTAQGSGNDINKLFKHASIALNKSVKAGKNNFNFFTSELSYIVQEQLILEGSLRNALSNNELCLYYQPKVNLITGEITGVEALLRWQHPVKGLLSPVNFIPMAEETGLIIQIDEWVLREVFSLIKNNWPLNPNGKGLIAINISSQHFKAKNDIFLCIKNLMQEFNVNPKLIEIEITENVLLENSRYNLKVLNKLIDMGFNLSLDDFGTGFSSLNYLLQIPAQSVKIDKSFIDGLPNNKNSIAIVRSIVTLCHSLNKKVIAEGVETLEQAQFLKQEGCDEIQGYYFSPPVSIDEFKILIFEQKKLVLE